MSDDDFILKDLRDITKNKECWAENIDNVAAILDKEHSDSVKAKVLLILGEMGLKHPAEIERYVDVIAGYLDDDNPKLRERSANAIGRIGRADKNLVLSYMGRLMEMRFDESENVRHAFVWACENIALNAPELFCEKLEIFLDMISDTSLKARIESPEIFRVVGKRKPECVKPYLEKLEWISQNDENSTVRIHSAGAVRITENALRKH